MTELNPVPRYLPAPVTLTSVFLAVCERVDILIDFSNLRPGTKVVLTNSANALPLTGVEVVDHIVTELALIDVTSGGLLLRELAPDATLDLVQSLSEPPLLLPPGGPKPMPI